MIKTWMLTQCIFMFIAGQAVQVLLIAIPKIKEKCRAANKAFSWKEWWKCDWNIVIATMCIGAMVIVGLDEIIKWKPGVLDILKWSFAGVGAFGSQIAMAKMSQYEKSLMNLLDIKSNVADKVTGGSTTVKETMEKFEEASGGDTVEASKKGT